MEEQEIKNPWCAYGMTRYSRFGKIRNEYSSSVGIRNTDKTNIESLWSNKYVKRFETLEEAVELVAKSTEQPVKKLMQNASEDFLSYFKNKSKE